MLPPIISRVNSLFGRLAYGLSPVKRGTNSRRKWPYAPDNSGHRAGLPVPAKLPQGQDGKFPTRFPRESARALQCSQSALVQKAARNDPTRSHPDTPGYTHSFLSTASHGPTDFHGFTFTSGLTTATLGNCLQNAIMHADQHIDKKYPWDQPGSG